MESKGFERDKGESALSILDYFSGTAVFVTGGTGFLGKLLVEKLLRTCLGVDRIYLLIRAKKGKSVEQRFDEMLGSPLFDRLKKEQPNFENKIALVVGDCTCPDLGLKEDDVEMLADRVNIMFHCAATVRFDERLRTAAYINVRATKDALGLFKKLKDAKSFVYISTAFSNCVNKEIKEQFYEPPMSADKLLDLVDAFDDKYLEKITPKLIEKWPNTYSFSKAVAEGVVEKEGKGLPIAVVRPSIVISTVKEPVPGWIDNIYGVTGVLVGAGLGFIRAINCKIDNMADIVPADYVINCTIAAAWEAGTKRTDNPKNESSPVYNYVCSVQQPITWRKCMNYIKKHGEHAPSELSLWYPFIIICSSYPVYALCAFLLHTIPAYLADFAAYCFGKQALLVKGYQKIDKLLNVLTYFGVRQWVFRNDNTQKLWAALSSKDKTMFNFDMGDLSWDTFFFTYARGCRLFLLKEPSDTIPQAKGKYLRLKVMHYTLVAVLMYGLVKLSMFTLF